MENGAVRSLLVVEAHEAKMRLEARPIASILDQQTQEVVGWLYEWNTGERVPKWKDGKRADFTFCKTGA